MRVSNAYIRLTKYILAHNTLSNLLVSEEPQYTNNIITKINKNHVQINIKLDTLAYILHIETKYIYHMKYGAEKDPSTMVI